jgi:hypothetical protein
MNISHKPMILDPLLIPRRRETDNGARTDIAILS